MNAAFGGMAATGLQNSGGQAPLPPLPPTQVMAAPAPSSQASGGFAPPINQTGTAMAPPGQPPGSNLAPGQAPAGIPPQGQAPASFSAIGAMRPGSGAPQFSSQFSTMGAFPSAMPQHGYTSSPGAPPHMMPPGVLGSAPAGMMPRYPAPSFSPIGRQQIFTPRPPLGAPPVPPSSIITLQRPPVSGMRLIPPVLKPPPGIVLQDATVKGANAVIVSSEKPHTTVYVGKIASTVEDDFLRPLLELCGPIRSWKRAQDPTTGSPKGFGFCEFDTAEGVLRALRLLNKFTLDGQELVLNVNQATREYLERYVTLKKERERQLKERAQEDDKEEEMAPGVEKTHKPSPGQSKEDCLTSAETEPEHDGKKFGLVNDADRLADDFASEKLTSMMEVRARLKPLPPPSALPATSELAGKSSSALEGSVKSKDADSNFDETRSDDAIGKIEDETTSENKTGLDPERPGTSGSERGRRTDRDRERDREREMEREKERELERFERERERERARRERDREVRTREAERLYEEREREWEGRERERERQRLHDKEREKERERDRRREVKEQEEESDDDDWRKRHYRGNFQDEQRKRRQREREEDLADRLREEQDLAEAKKRKIEEPSNSAVRMEVDTGRQPFVDSSKQGEFEASSVSLKNGKDSMSAAFESESDELPDSKSAQSNGAYAITYDSRRDGEAENSSAMTEIDQKLNSSSAPRKLGFGIIGSGRRASVPWVFHQEDEEDAPKDRKLRPLVPIDYSAEELQAVPPQSKSSSKLAPNLVAAAEFAKSLSNLGKTTSPGNDGKTKEGDRDKSRRLGSDRSRRDRDREKDRDRDRSKDWDREKEKKEKERDRDVKVYEKEQSLEKAKPPENKNILDAKQLIDTIPKTKEELFAYPVDWSIYDKHDLHERMRPWISKKITDFLGEEETTLVDFIVKNTQNHLTAANMLELLEAILDDEAEMFVLKMWRMLIFEIRRIETGLAFRPRS
ncbi:hypothetical protein O6H91_12G048600 [Diphasiastrum complanatum]|uniref:Uncharacterized protein n=1 Tax=Diphasiastrum complanatum TaxID=34168 RepID=A0ACC2C1N2_DIPCM|nr:hypothetical protein O6H91_12G048600 [Diphasiastrum complanatum]